MTWHGATTRDEWRSDHALAHALRRARVRRLYPRAYADPAAVNDVECRWAAALLSAGAGAALGGRSAAMLHGLPVATCHVVELVLPPGRQLRRHPDRIARRPTVLDDSDLTWRRGFRATTVERTLFDLSGSMPVDEVATLLVWAVQHRRTTLPRVRAALSRRPRLRGAATMRKVLEQLQPGHDNGWELEVAQALRRCGLPSADYGVVIDTPDGPRKPDAYWKLARVALETDGRAAHFELEGWERTLERDSALAAVGVAVVHVTYRQWRRDRERCLLRLARVLRSRWPDDEPWPANAPRAGRSRSNRRLIE